MRDIKRLMDKPKIARDFGVLRGPVWKTVECETANGVTLLPLGRNQSPRGALVDGKRPTLVLVDDLEDTERCMNPRLRQNDWIGSSRTSCSLPKSKETSTVSTPIPSNTRIACPSGSQIRPVGRMCTSKPSPIPKTCTTQLTNIFGKNGRKFMET